MQLSLSYRDHFMSQLASFKSAQKQLNVLWMILKQEPNICVGGTHGMSGIM